MHHLTSPLLKEIECPKFNLWGYWTSLLLYYHYTTDWQSSASSVVVVAIVFLFYLFILMTFQVLEGLPHFLGNRFHPVLLVIQFKGIGWLSQFREGKKGLITQSKPANQICLFILILFNMAEALLSHRHGFCNKWWCNRWQKYQNKLWLLYSSFIFSSKLQQL